MFTFIHEVLLKRGMSDLLFFFFLIWTIFKVSWICYNTVSVLCFGFLVVGLLTHLPGIEPAPFALEGEVLATGPPGKSLPTLNYQRWDPGKGDRTFFFFKHTWSSGGKKSDTWAFVFFKEFQDHSDMHLGFEKWL